MKVVSANSIADLEKKFPLFFQEAYAKYELSKGWTVLLIGDENEGIIPIRTRKSRLIKQGQYLYPPVKNGERLSSAEERDFLENMLAFCRQASICDFLMPPLHYSVFQSLPAGSYYTGQGILQVNLLANEEEILKGFSSNYRNEIRKAMAENLTVKFENRYFNEFYAMYKSTHERQGIYYDPVTDIKNLIASLGEEKCRIATVLKGDQVFGAAIVLWNADEGYYFQSGAVDDCPYPGANKLLQLEIMKWLKQKGVKRYCMGGYRLGDVSGTKYDGIQKFKLRFGAQIEKGYHFYSKISWKYGLYNKVLNMYLAMRGIKQNRTGQDFKYN